MRATGWHGGGSPEDAAGYGIKFTERDRDQYFRTDWSEVAIEVGDSEATISLSPSFWRTCSELRSAELGRWLLESGAAPWLRGQPPSIAVRHVDGNRFTARVIGKHNLL